MSVKALALRAAPFELQVSMGLVPGVTSVNKFGSYKEVGTDSVILWDAPETLDALAEYQYIDFAAPETLYVSSSDNADTSTLTIWGLGLGGVEQTGTVTLQGQTKVPVPDTVWSRTFRAWNSGTTLFAGKVYAYTDDTVSLGVPDTNGTTKLAVMAEHQQTEMAMYTVPLGHTAYLQNGKASSGKGKDATGHFFVRSLGGVFRTNHSFLLFENSYDYRFVCPPALPQLTDMEVRVATSTGTIEVHAAFTLCLVDDTINTLLGS